MPAILKNKHARFCDWLEDVKRKQAVNDPEMDNLQAEIVRLHSLYQQKIEEVRVIIEAYEKKQKQIRGLVKARQKTVLRNTESLLVAIAAEPLSKEF